MSMRRLALTLLVLLVGCVSGSDFQPPPCTTCQGADSGSDGGTDAGSDAGVDSGTPDAGWDAGSDGGLDLTVMEWNLQFFGKADAGPQDDALQAQNVATVMGQQNADLWALEEVCDESRLSDVLGTLATTYNQHYDVVLPDTASVSNPYSGFGGPWGQKTALLFRQGLFTKLGAQLVFDPTDTGTGNSIDSSWGTVFAARDPIEVHLQVATPAGPKDLWVVVVHLKAGSGSFSQRLQESADLKTYLDEYHPNDALMMLGDFNDDLDASIDGTNPSPFANFVADTASYAFPTEAFTQANVSTTVVVFGNGPIDHHLDTNELFGNLVQGSPAVLHPQITSYGTTTSDHWPTRVRYHYP